VLGTGHKILDADVASTLASHRVVRGEVRAAAVRPVPFVPASWVETRSQWIPLPAAAALRLATVEDLRSDISRSVGWHGR
jgi:hypothetical protein